MSIKYPNANSALVNILRGVMKNGNLVKSRNGDTKELPMVQFHVMNPLDRYITVPGRAVHIPAQIYETMWVLSGSNDISVLKEYLPKAPDFSDDGVTWRAGYGPRLRSFGTNRVDQLKKVVDLLREDPNTRQAVISIFDGNIDHTVSKDIPCNNWLHFINRGGKLNLHVATRSNDIMWGWSGINNFEWSVLLEIVAYLTDLNVGPITYSISSIHVYDRHFNKAQRIIEANEGCYLSNPISDFVDKFLTNNESTDPRFDSASSIEELDADIAQWHKVEEIIRTEGWTSRAAAETVKIRSRLFKAFAHCIAMWHTKDYDLFPYLEGTQIMESLKLSPTKVSITKPGDNASGVGSELTGFMKDIDELHREKDKAYGISWRKRGEVLGIMANLARKVDRLGANGGGDTALDTVTDLAVYAVKYHVYLSSNGSVSTDENAITNLVDKLDSFFSSPSGGVIRFPVGEGTDVDDPDEVTKRLCTFSKNAGLLYVEDVPIAEQSIKTAFANLEEIVINHGNDQGYKVDGMGKIEWVEYLAVVALATANTRNRDNNPESQVPLDRLGWGLPGN